MVQGGREGSQDPRYVSEVLASKRQWAGDKVWVGGSVVLQNEGVCRDTALTLQLSPLARPAHLSGRSLVELLDTSPAEPVFPSVK